MSRFIQTTHQVSLFHRWEKGGRKKRILCLSLSKSDEITHYPQTIWFMALPEVTNLCSERTRTRRLLACCLPLLWPVNWTALSTAHCKSSSPIPGSSWADINKEIIQKANSNPGVIDRSDASSKRTTITEMSQSKKWPYKGGLLAPVMTYGWNIMNICTKYHTQISIYMNKSIINYSIVLKCAYKFFETPSSRRWSLNSLPLPKCRQDSVISLLMNRIWKGKKE